MTEGSSNSPLGNLPSAEALQGMIGTLMANPDLMKNIIGALGNTAIKDGDDQNSTPSAENEEKEKSDTAPANANLAGALSPELMSKLPVILSLLGGNRSAPKSKSEADREALLCALKPYLSRERVETVEKIIQISRLGDLLGSL